MNEGDWVTIIDVAKALLAVPRARAAQPDMFSQKRGGA